MTGALYLPALAEWLKGAAIGGILGPFGRMTLLTFLMGISDII